MKAILWCSPKTEEGGGDGLSQSCSLQATCLPCHAPETAVHSCFGHYEKKMQIPRLSSPPLPPLSKTTLAKRRPFRLAGYFFPFMICSLNYLDDVVSCFCCAFVGILVSARPTRKGVFNTVFLPEVVGLSDEHTHAHTHTLTHTHTRTHTYRKGIAVTINILKLVQVWFVWCCREKYINVIT